MFKIFLDNLSLFEIKSKILFDFVYFGIHVIMNSSGFNSGSSTCWITSDWIELDPPYE